jgi:hypothetical protein
MKTNAERIKEFLDRFDIDESIFNKKAGLGNGAVANNLKNKGKFSDKSLERILTSYPDIRKEWLYFGTGDMLISDTKKPDKVISQAEYDKAMEENKTLKDELLRLSQRLIELLDKR